VARRGARGPPPPAAEAAPLNRGGQAATGLAGWRRPHAALEPGELLALTRHLRPRLVPGEEPPAPAVAERIVQMSAEELRELGQRLSERLALEAAQG
jgi:hypothetical protein